MGIFKNILRTLRTSQGLTQEELAKRLKISRSTIGMYEKGAREPDFETLELIADFFNVDINYLLGRSNKTTLGNKKIMAKNIQFYMDKYQKTRNDMCEALGVKYTTFTDWVKGNSYPRIDKIELMANYFGISKADLVEDHSTSTTSRKSTVINVYGRVAAGIPLEMIEDIIDTEEIPEEMAKTGEYFGLQISGDSMEPKISNGDTVIVRKQDDADSEDIVIATVNGTDATCKRLKKYQTGIALISTNPKYEPMFFSNEEIIEKPVRIIGRVVELRAKFR